MKAEVIKNQTSKAMEYPCLMLNVEHGFIVLLTEPKTGTIVNNNTDPAWQLGQHCNSWAMHQLTPLDGVVKLSNEEEK